LRLNILHLFGREPRNSEPVIEAAPIQAVEQRKIRALCGNDHFAADFMLEPMPAAKTRPLSGCLRVAHPWMELGVDHLSQSYHRAQCFVPRSIFRQKKASAYRAGEAASIARSRIRL
jgi:hypothetical protein